MSSQPQNRQEFETSLIVRAWQDESFKQELITNPKAVYEKELGKKAPENCTITVLEETADQMYLILPAKPVINSSDELSESALEAVAGGGPYFIKGGSDWIALWN